MIWIYGIYYRLYLKFKMIKKWGFILTIIHCAYFLFKSLTDENYIIEREVFIVPWIYFIFFLFICKIFHVLFGQYWIIKYICWQTKEFQKNVMDKNIKAAGKRRGYKDTIQSGMVSNFVVCSKEKIKKQIEQIEVHLFYFDLKKVNKFIKENIGVFNVASKKKKKAIYMELLASERMFLKKRYEKLEQQLLDDFASTSRTLRLSNSKYIVTDGVNPKHVLEILYDYLYLKWRLEIDVWVIANQPCFQYYDFKKKKYKMAKVFSPDLKATKERHIKNKEGNKIVEYVSVEFMMAEDWICFWESESDVWWNNIDTNVKKNIEERGIRWWEVAQGHIMGENILNLRNGQVAGRTVKIQRDLEESFYSVTRAVKIWGGSKRIFLIKVFMFLFAPLFKLKPNLKSKLYQKIERLRMDGWLKLETVFSRTEAINYNAPGISLLQLLDKNESLYMSQYQTTLVFRIRDCWGKYNTHYLEYLAEKLTENSSAALLELPEWDPDLKLKENHIKAMNYDTVDVFRLDPEKKYSENPRYKKIEKNTTKMGL